jgi:hypothetical protein
MRKFNKVAAQGDLMVMKIDSLPKDVELTEVKPERGQLIVTHSETGHHHVMVPTKAKMYENKDRELEAFLVVSSATTLDHLRENHTHEPLLFNPGVYKIRRQREYTPEGYRRVQD